MNIQIIGIKKCQETRKAERFFKERKISYHFLDLNERALSKGELEKIKIALGLENIVDKSGKEYKKRNLHKNVNKGDYKLSHCFVSKYCTLFATKRVYS